jgi:hypothetical protein
MKSVLFLSKKNLKKKKKIKTFFKRETEREREGIVQLFGGWATLRLGWFGHSGVIFYVEIFLFFIFIIKPIFPLNLSFSFSHAILNHVPKSETCLHCLFL